MTQAFSLSPRAGTARLYLAGLLSLTVGLGPVLAQHGPAQGDGPGPQGSQSHLRLEGWEMVPALSLAHHRS
ncbi:hypothetical protein [Methylorubrum extorquens]|uniref:Uncharacterized protein n=1 Tax=Methylorubrum extorquens DSM 13060 TaxID=882800 RepID=H1KHV9_METEX|nr:hypothetical protein [Methylorubrum extorquens]EHP92861.1 hypothetical protein MetexDRAFT_2221 [Methylorubrum extorquens DSM 13060]